MKRFQYLRTRTDQLMNSTDPEVFFAAYQKSGKINDELYDIFKKQLDQSQHKLRRHRSVVTQLLLFLDLLYKKYDEKENEFFVLYQDFKRLLIVFHTLYALLLQKIERRDIGGNFSKIIASYLSHPQQYVEVIDCISETVLFTIGVT